MNRPRQSANGVGEDDLDSVDLRRPGKRASTQRTWMARWTSGDALRSSRRLGTVGQSDDGGDGFGS
jgi:hypothetical protein